MGSRRSVRGDFDVIALWETVDEQRVARGMTWHGVTRTLGWMSQGTIARMRERGTATCNHVLPMIQWVGRTPESFTVDPEGAVHELLPDPGDQGWRWWWRCRDLAADLEAQRLERKLTRKALVAELGLARGQITALQQSRYGTEIGVAMIIARWLGRSAASYMTEVPPQLQKPGLRA
jgi:hypothetical protein